jgi:6-pyruvoyltetrahydropterin/6-carboxytetrahydropterin synthase
MNDKYTISRQIEIDAGHRVTYHGSKCKNLHGHRYKIVATCSGPLFQHGEQQGMVLDFGFLKDEMVQQIHNFCDHAMILWIDDPLTPLMLENSDISFHDAKEKVAQTGYVHTHNSLGGALYVIGNVPTAEVLAQHWYNRLSGRIQDRSSSQAELIAIEVHETPNCIARYPL